MRKEFLKECLQQLNNMNFCYVYTKAQLEEVLKNFKGDATYVPNECGYTIKVIKKVEKK